MTLIAEDKLQDIIIRWPELTRERRELLVDFMQSLTPDELTEMVECDETPAQEVSFIRACCGLPRLELVRPL